MNARSFELVALLLVLSPTVPKPVSSATAAELEVQIYAGLSITGSVGTVYSIEFASELAAVNREASWRCLEFLRLPANPYLWMDRSAAATGKRFYRALAFSAPTGMVFIPPGTFRMGSPTNEVDRKTGEGPQTWVAITRGFWMGKCEVTQLEYWNQFGVNPSWFNGDSGWLFGDYGTKVSRPVETVSWHDATNYCAQLTLRDRQEGRIPINCVYRLPTEAEWEYACRAGTSTRFSFAENPDPAKISEYAWVREYLDKTQEVGTKLSNPWGLHDMHGNVAEWCQDWWLARLVGGIAVDPQGPRTGLERVIRGGDGFTSDCRSGARSHFDPQLRFSSVGFRVVLAVGL